MNLMSYGIPCNSKKTATKKTYLSLWFPHKCLSLWFSKLVGFGFFFFNIFYGLFVPTTMASGPLRLVWMFCISEEYLFIHWWVIQFSECSTVTLCELRNNNRFKMIGRNLNKDFHDCFQNCSVIVLSTPTIYCWISKFFLSSLRYIHMYVCMQREREKCNAQLPANYTLNNSCNTK